MLAGSRFMRGGLPVLLGSRAAQVRLELVLVLQQPARLPRRIRRRHGPARRRMVAARSRRWDRRARRRFCSSTASAGRRAVRLPARRGRATDGPTDRTDSTIFARGKRALSGRSTARASKPSRCAGTAVSTPIGTPARTTAARRWRGAATPISTPLAIASSAPRTGPNSRSKPGYASTGAALGLTLDPAPIAATADGAIVFNP